MTGPSFRPVGSKAVTLGFENFRPGQQVLGTLSTAAYHDVSLNHVLALKGNIPFRAYIKGVFERGEQISAAGELVVSINPNGNEGRVMVRSARPAPAFPTASHPDVLVYVSANNGTSWTQKPVKAVDFAAGTVTFDKDANTNRIAVFYLIGDGELELRAVRPMGSDSGSAKLYGAPFRTIHESDQSKGTTAPKLGSRPRYDLPQQFRLELAVRSNSKVEWTARARHELALAADDIAGQVINAQQLSALGELGLRGGSL